MKRDPLAEEQIAAARGWSAAVPSGLEVGARTPEQLDRFSAACGERYGSRARVIEEARAQGGDREADAAADAIPNTGLWALLASVRSEVSSGGPGAFVINPEDYEAVMANTGGVFARVNGVAAWAPSLDFFEAGVMFVPGPVCVGSWERVIVAHPADPTEEAVRRAHAAIGDVQNGAFPITATILREDDHATFTEFAGICARLEEHQKQGAVLMDEYKAALSKVSSMAARHGR
jgi:hypothetical protein